MCRVLVLLNSVCSAICASSCRGSVTSRNFCCCQKAICSRLLLVEVLCTPSSLKMPECTSFPSTYWNPPTSWSCKRLFSCLHLVSKTLPLSLGRCSCMPPHVWGKGSPGNMQQNDFCPVSVNCLLLLCYIVLWFFSWNFQCLVSSQLTEIKSGD